MRLAIISFAALATLAAAQDQIAGKPTIGSFCSHDGRNERGGNKQENRLSILESLS